MPCGPKSSIRHDSIGSDRHPCFNKESAGSCGRVHLPVAPKCNIQCNYCNRKYDCVNESRPGVTSGILKPFQALEYTRHVLDKEPRITVIGIAGPGDPMANPEETLETMRLIKAEYPHMLFCLSSNGLAMPQYVDDLAALGVTHATVTMSTIDPEIGAKIYAWAREGNVVYRGVAAAELLLSRQLESIAALKAHGLAVKINTIVIPGVNTIGDYAPIKAVAEKARELGADIMNSLPMHPTAGTPFGALAEPSRDDIHALREEIDHLVPQMTHCRRCRADAVGLLCGDRSGELSGVLAACGKLTSQHQDDRPYVAVATISSVLVDTHLGAARRLQIWGMSADGGFRLKEERTAVRGLGGGCGCGDSIGIAGGSGGCGGGGGGGTDPGRMGEAGWRELAANLSDCRAVVAQEAGDAPHKILGEHGIPVIVASGTVKDALRLVYGLQSARLAAACEGSTGA